jgi:hypothetical protein
VGRAAFTLPAGAYMAARTTEAIDQAVRRRDDGAGARSRARARQERAALAYARDERPWAGHAPPDVAYVYAPDRKHARPAEHLAGFSASSPDSDFGIDVAPTGLH